MTFQDLSVLTAVGLESWECATMLRSVYHLSIHLTIYHLSIYVVSLKSLVNGDLLPLM